MSNFLSLDLEALETVTGGKGPVVSGAAAGKLYDSLRAQGRKGDSRISQADNVSGGVLHGSVDAGPISCDAQERPGSGRPRTVTCSLNPF